MLKLFASTVLAVALIASPAQAALVTVTGAGTFSTATGQAYNGETFAFNATYDDAAPLLYAFGGNSYFLGLVSVAVSLGGGAFVNAFSATPYISDSSVFNLLGSGSYSGPEGTFSIALNRPAGSTGGLPSASEIAGKAGTFFYNQNVPTSQGRGTFTAAVTSVPEPATWGMMILGMGAVGLAMRRRKRVTTRVAFAV